MMDGRSIFLFSLLLCVALCREYKWTAQGPADPDHEITFRLMLRQQNIDSFQRHVLDVADPDSPNYGKWMSIDEVLDWIAPEEAESVAVQDWASSFECATDVINQRDSIKVISSVSCAEKILSVPFVIYRHKYGHTAVRRDLSMAQPIIPDALSHVVEFVSGVDILPPVRKAKLGASAGSSTGSSIGVPGEESFKYIIPEVIRRIYNVPAGTRVSDVNATQSVVEFTPEGAPSFSDLKQFSTECGEEFNNITKIVGPFNIGGDGESLLDVQYITTVGAAAPTWYITINNGWVLDMANELFNLEGAPLVNSVSYGWMESLSCGRVVHANCTGAMDPQEYVLRANKELSKVAARGLSVLAASQDEGAPSDENIACSNDDTHPLWPIYPASSPWVTAVGGTTLVDQTASRNQQDQTLPPICDGEYPCDTDGNLEKPCMPNNTAFTWTTGGGFSDYAPQPKYQKDAVAAYLKSDCLIPPSKFFHPENRGYPDVAAVGARILVVSGGQVTHSAGTSASTPIFSGIVSLLNDHRLSQGKSPLGFLNPLLYKMAAHHPKAFNRVTSGDNKGTIGRVCKYGYGECGAVGHGWSPTTGLGTPDYTEMLKYLDEKL